MQKIKNYRKKKKAVSTVLAVLLMIAVAVAASLVAYAWVMGYLGFITGRTSKAIMIQSVGVQGEDLLIYVQNVGQGSVSLTDIYVDDIQEWHDNGLLMPENQTEAITLTGYCADWQSGSSHDLTIRAVTSDGTFMEMTPTVTAGGGGGGGTAVLNNFVLMTIGGQMADVPFSITITAKDQYGATFTSYSGTNTLSVTGGGTITPTTTTGGFVGGVWTGDVTLDTVGTGVQITTIGGGKSGTSNTFDVSSVERVFSGFTIKGTYPTTVALDVSFGDVVVTAVDQFGDPFTTYTGSVWFTSTAEPQNIILPEPGTQAVPYVFGLGDNGVHTFAGFMFQTLEGTFTVSVTDGTFSTPSSPILVTESPALSYFVFAPISSQTAGDPFSIMVTAMDQYDDVLSDYTGTVQFTSTDAQAVLPGDYTFVVGDSGSRTFTDGVTLKTSGSQTVTVTDSPVSTTSDPITVDPAEAAVLTVSGFPDPVTAGTAGSVTVTAVDAYGNTATGYTGTIQFSSTDPQAVLPGDYTFVVGDSGTRTFTNGVTLKTSGERSITATDTVTGTITGTQSAITVDPAGAASLTVAGFPDPVNSGTAGSVTVTAYDAYSNIATGYTGTVTFTSSDGSASLPADHAFVGGDSGVHVFSVTLNTIGEQSITATDTVTSSITSSQTAITVNAAAPQTLTLRPNGSGTSTQLSNNDGSWPYMANWECVDESSSDSDSTYVYRGSSGSAIDTYNIPNTANSGLIDRIVVHYIARYVGTSGTARAVIRTGGTEYYGGPTPQPLTTTYTEYTYTWNTNPGTSTAWTWANIDALQIGIELSRPSGGFGTREARCTQIWVEIIYTP